MSTASLMARRPKRAVQRPSSAAFASAGRERALEVSILQLLAQRLASEIPTDEVAGFVRAAERLLGGLEIGPLWTGGVTDHLPRRARAVRIYGPLASGKTVCGRRLVRQAVTVGRHVTVVRALGGPPRPDEYAFADIAPDSLSLVDTEGFVGDDLGRAVLTHADSVAGPATVIVDIASRALSVVTPRLIRTLTGRADTTFIVLVSDPSDLAGFEFDTEIVLPGDPSYSYTPHIREALERLTTDDLTLDRFSARLNGGGAVAMSRYEQQILDWFSDSSAEYSYLLERRSRVEECPHPWITAGECRLAHGFLKGPDETLAIFTLPTSADVLRTAFPSR